MGWPWEDRPVTNSSSSPRDSALIRAARRQTVPHTPVWFMRQAGRSLPEYRKVREGVGMLDSCRTPDLVAEITMQPVRRHGVDAAILFSDIVVPLAAVGVDLDIVPGVGPVVAQPFRTHADLDRIPELTPEHVPYITEAVGMVLAELGATPLIGFAGAPFTLASYLIEGWRWRVCRRGGLPLLLDRRLCPPRRPVCRAGEPGPSVAVRTLAGS